ncbi:hypothetical protein T11_12172 [Trichinella zimbabwensis]|uniref:Uncharacterized protein n=1 Tax=Trichinella zimbabwensis TaxID=268475 RepID=A0A0V1GZY9_9BILA|nr:hypothetical protein T11_12172 [Trichinella zimbabwensis]
MQFFTFPLLILTVYWDRFFRVQSQKPNDDFQTEDLRDNLAVQKKHVLLKKSSFFIWPYFGYYGFGYSYPFRRFSWDLRRRRLINRRRRRRRFYRFGRFLF